MKIKNKDISGGFTLIELLVVISIIGLLAAAIFAALTVGRDKAKIAKANLDLKSIFSSVELKRDSNNVILQGITGSYYTAGGASGVCLGANLKGVSDTSACMVWLNSQWQKLGYANAPRDPWNSPYMIDENELESGSCSTSSKDTIRSNGPDGIFATSDDITLSLPFFKC